MSSAPPASITRSYSPGDGRPRRLAFSPCSVGQDFIVARPSPCCICSPRIFPPRTCRPRRLYHGSYTFPRLGARCCARFSLPLADPIVETITIFVIFVARPRTQEWAVPSSPWLAPLVFHPQQSAWQAPALVAPPPRSVFPPLTFLLISYKFYFLILRFTKSVNLEDPNYVLFII